MKNFRKVIFLFVILLAIFIQPVMAAPEKAPLLDQVVFNSEFVLEAGETFYGNIISFNGSIFIEEDAKLYGDLIMFGGEIELFGMVYGNIISYGADNVHEYENMIEGEVIAFGGGTQSVDRLPEEQPLSIFVEKNLVERFFNRFLNGFGDVLGIVLTGLVFSTISILLHLIGKDRFIVTLDTMRKEPIVSFFIGLVLFIAVPILAVLLAVTILLIPISLLSLLFFTLMIFVSVSVMGQLIGQFLMDLFKADWTEIIQTGVGTFVFMISLIFLMKLPCLGWSLTMLILSFGVGAFLLSSFGSRIFSREV